MFVILGRHIIFRAQTQPHTFCRFNPETKCFFYESYTHSSEVNFLNTKKLVTKRFAGIGNQIIDGHARYAIHTCSKIIYEKGYHLVTGGAKGADTEFEKYFPERNTILRAKDATPKSIQMAEEFHPAWNKCNAYVRALMGRNAMIIMGEDLKTPVEFVLCYCVDEEKGGTSFGIKIARYYKIPVYNLANDNGLDVMKELEND